MVQHHRNGDHVPVTLSVSEWVKLIVFVVGCTVVYTVGAYRFIDDIRDELTGRMIVLEQRDKASEEDRARLRTIESDIKRILERMPRS
jgi:excinuclease UvrABC helicase subunit UvrB